MNMIMAAGAIRIVEARRSFLDGILAASSTPPALRRSRASNAAWPRHGGR